MNISSGSIVKYRERDWVVLPVKKGEILSLRPLGGSWKKPISVYLPLQKELEKRFPKEEIKSSEFPLPDLDSIGTLEETRLFVEANRLLLREGAAPFRSFGNISIRPRPYQLVPLIMALRLDPIRLLIADDVGVGKTIEAGLIARELLDRGEIDRICVLCPPYLCEQWKKELAEKFSIDAVVVRSGTISTLERQVGSDNKSIFEYFPHIIVSIDLVKTDRYKNSFSQFAPNFIIVDEAHGATKPAGGKSSSTQQQRYELLKNVFKEDRQGIFVTATPHSGKEESFLSLLGLLKPEFASYRFSSLTESQRKELAKHFVQRRRADVKKWMDADTPFPERDNKESEKTYKFSKEYFQFFSEVYDFARNIVEEGEKEIGVKRRMKFWSALALLRSVTSSPAAAESSLRGRIGEATDKKETEVVIESEEELNSIISPLIEDTDEESPQDSEPSEVIRMQEEEEKDEDRFKKKFREFAKTATSLKGKLDSKLQTLFEVVDELVANGYHPILWCRYIATAEYIKLELTNRFKKNKELIIDVVTGKLDDEDRKEKIEELQNAKQRILVATDCLSEGINLQKAFNAVVHYDLPWNPNRLEQREGRVDRYGQISPVVKVHFIFGNDNPVDGAVWEVLVKKAKDIQKHLGVTVPVPIDSENVLDAILRSIFKSKKRDPREQELFAYAEEQNTIQKLHDDWDISVEKEKLSRTRFAQHSIQPSEVEEEINRTDQVLGNAEDIRRFLQEISQRGKQKDPLTMLEKKKGLYYLAPISKIHFEIQQKLERYHYPEDWKISFTSPEPEDTTFIGRNHPLVEGFAEMVLEEGIGGTERLRVSRASVVRTEAVKERTTLLVLRSRYLLQEGDGEEKLAEEILSLAFVGNGDSPEFQTYIESEELLQKALPSGNMKQDEIDDYFKDFQSDWKSMQKSLQTQMKERAKEWKEIHSRIRKTTSGKKQMKVEWKGPVDCMGVIIYIPLAKGRAL